MNLDQFEVQKFVGRGRFSLVYHVQCKRKEDKNNYALKRAYLQNPDHVYNALREYVILKRIATADIRAYFVVNLYYSFYQDGSIIFVLSKGSGMDLYDIVENLPPLNEEFAKFYCTEIMCGLEELHRIGVVHLDIKPENILLSLSGHVMISDYDCAFDVISSSGGQPKLENYRGTFLYMAPEIANMKTFSFNADIWSLGCIMAILVSGGCRPKVKINESRYDQARQGKWEIEDFEKLSKALQSFLRACFIIDPDKRPDIATLKQYDFFNGVIWDKDLLMRQHPPILPPLVIPIIDKKKYCFNLKDEKILSTANWSEMPLLPDNLRYSENSIDISQLGTVRADTPKFLEAGLTPEHIKLLFSDIDFINERDIPNYSSWN